MNQDQLIFHKNERNVFDDDDIIRSSINNDRHSYVLMLINFCIITILVNQEKNSEYHWYYEHDNYLELFCCSIQVWTLLYT